MRKPPNIHLLVALTMLAVATAQAQPKGGAQGPDGKATPAQGTGKNATPAQSSDNKATPAQGSDNKATPAAGSDNKATPAQGSDNKGTPNQGNENKATPNAPGGAPKDNSPAGTKAAEPGPASGQKGASSTAPDNAASP